MNKNLFKLLLMVVLVLAITTACSSGGSEDAGTSGTTSAGKDLFSQMVIGAQAGCASCHSLKPGEVLVGPSMAGIGTRAGSTVSGESAAEYIKQSILDPDAHIVDGFSAGLMPGVWAQELTDQQVNDLVDYLVSLK